MRASSMTYLAFAAAVVHACDDSNLGNSTWHPRLQDSLVTLYEKWYDDTTGLWNNGGLLWWQSANSLTTLLDMAIAGDCVAQFFAGSAMPTTFTNAQIYDEQNGNNLKVRSIEERDTGDGFINKYYDDEGWWAMAWIRAYDYSGNTTYLDAANNIFNNMIGGWGNNPCSSSAGEWWDKAQTSVGTISTVLFLEVASFLANRDDSSMKPYYVYYAESAWEFMNSDLGTYDKTDHIVRGDLNDTSCQVSDQINFTYTDGALLGGLVELYRATQNSTYLDAANNLAQGVINLLTVDGVLSEPHINQAGPGVTSAFKGVFMRGLSGLQAVDPNPLYKSFALACADSIWNNNREGDSQGNVYFGPDWNGPFYQSPDPVPQSSAMDALVAAWLA